MASSRSTPGLRKPTGAPRSTRYEVFGFGVANGAPAVLIDRIGPDNYWFRAQPLILLDRCGAGVDQMIAQLRAGVANSPYPNTYRHWSGPNSNIFLRTSAGRFPSSRSGFPRTGSARISCRAAAAPSRSGFQVSLYGVIGILLAVREGLEVNLPGLSLGVAPVRPALRVPALGRLGMAGLWSESRRSFRLLSQEVLYDLPAGGAPDAGMRADVFERGIESADPMRLAGDKGMDRNRHNAGDRLALVVKRVELAPQHRLEFGH
jgi:hypothetical protein